MLDPPGRSAGATPEAQLVLGCARARTDPEAGGRLHRLARADLAWDRVLDLARRHGVLPLVYTQLLAACPDAMPRSARQALGEHFLGNAQRCLYLAGELASLLDALRADGIPAIPYKGPALAAALYGNVALRQAGDLDVLVAPQHAWRARMRLISRGYRPHVELSADEDAAYRRAHADYALVRDADRVVVELHWALAAPYFSFPFDVDGLWSRLESLPLAGATVPAIPPGDLLLLLCVHGGRHLWERLAWLCDVAELLRRPPAVDWAAVTAQARALGCERILLLSLRLCQALLGTRLPDPVLRRIARDPGAESLAASLAERLFRATPGTAGVFENVRTHLAMRERWRDRARYCVLRTLTPTEHDRPRPGGRGVVDRARRLARLAREYGLAPRGPTR